LASRPPLISSDSLYEVVDGRIVEKSIGAFESGIATDLTRVLGTFARDNRLGQGSCQMLYRIGRERDLSRRPDVSFDGNSRWPWNRRPPRVEA
jgi:Uma2 family endonuclease